MPPELRTRLLVFGYAILLALWQTMAIGGAMLLAHLALRRWVVILAALTLSGCAPRLEHCSRSTVNWAAVNLTAPTIDRPCPPGRGWPF